jgi:hypothetical protein
LWSDSLNTGILLVQHMPPLPLASNYKVWVRDSLGRLDLVTTFTPDEHGNAQMVIQPEGLGEPVWLFVIAGSATSSSSEGPIVLQGHLDRSQPAADDAAADAEAEAEAEDVPVDDAEDAEVEDADGGSATEATAGA